MTNGLTSYANGSVFTVQLRMDQSLKKFFDTGDASATFRANEPSFDLAVVQFDDDGRSGLGLDRDHGVLSGVDAAHGDERL